ncbi:MAG: ABC transporter permease [Candidatus Aminicenantes bacterium]|jgi:ABC-type lipoprotein release transport system permease subunit|nr:ABC transporter permease [Candidatus Aminicenantes bacterium]
MWFYIKLAWRNIFRNKRRTLIAGIAIAIGLASLILSDAFMIGMENNIVKSATASFLGEAQIHGDGFRETQEVEITVRNFDEVITKLNQEEIVDKFTPRTLSFGMVTSPADVSSVLLVGVAPETEIHLSQIDEAVNRGSYFTGDDNHDIIIGSKLAEILEVSLGDRLVVTVAQAETGDLSQELFRISGIYHFNMKEMDSGMAFIRLEKAQQMLGIGSRVHEIAIKFKDKTYAVQEELPFWETYSQGGNEAVSWTKLLPQLKAFFDMTGISLFVMCLILASVVVFGIINTLFMSLYERMFEFGVLRAVGTRAAGVRKLVIFEAGALGIVSIILGVILGFVSTLLFTKTGIDYRGIEFAGTTIKDMLYPEMNVLQFIIYPIGVFIFMLIVGLYPAFVAGRMSIADALRKSL